MFDMMTLFGFGPLVTSCLIALAPQAPAPPARPAPPAESAQFDFLVGEWDLEMTSKAPNAPPRITGTWKAHKAFDGFGIIDEWRMLGPAGETFTLAATFRIYDPRLERWTLRLLNVFQARWEEQSARWEDGQMRLEWAGTDQAGRPFRMRARYFDIRADRFSWRADRSYDDGRTWVEDFLTIEATRRATTR